MMSSKIWIWIIDFLTKFLHNVSSPVLKRLCKFQVDIPINARVTAVQNLENLYTFILRQPWWWTKECPWHTFFLLISIVNINYKFDLFFVLHQSETQSKLFWYYFTLNTLNVFFFELSMIGYSCRGALSLALLLRDSSSIEFILNILVFL